MTTTPDVPDFDIEAMMAELDAQTEEIIAANAEEAAPEISDEDIAAALEEDAAVINPKMLHHEPAAVVVEPSEDELALAEMIASQLDDAAPFEPTAVEILDAEQTLDLDEVMDQVATTEVEQVEVEEVLAVEVQPEVEVEVHQSVQVEEVPMVTVEPDAQIELENKSIPDFEPKPVVAPERSEKALLELTKLKYQPDIESFNREIGFTDATLDIAMTSQASLVAYQNERAARSSAQASRLKLKFDSIEAMLYEAYRKVFVEAGEKVTEKAIENAVRKDSRWRKAKEAVIEAEMYADIHKGFVFALKDRNDMLIQRGSYRRQEMQGQMRMNGDNSNASNNEAKAANGHAAAMAAMKQAKNT